MVCFRGAFIMPLFWITNLSNSLRAPLSNILRRYLIKWWWRCACSIYCDPVILEERKDTSDWTSLKMDMLVLYVFDVAKVRFLCILTLMMSPWWCHLDEWNCRSLDAFFSTRAEPVFMLGNLHGRFSWSLGNEYIIVTHTDFENWCTRYLVYYNNKLKFMFEISDYN